MGKKTKLKDILKLLDSGEISRVSPESATSIKLAIERWREAGMTDDQCVCVFIILTAAASFRMASEK